jgi:hypothetical protein
MADLENNNAGNEKRIKVDDKGHPHNTPHRKHQGQGDAHGGEHPHPDMSARAAQNDAVNGITEGDQSPTNANPATSSVSAGAPATAGGSNPVAGPAGAIADTAQTSRAGAQPIESPAEPEKDRE